jgi:hypothetical protein
MNEDKVEYVFDQHKSQPPQVISMTQERYDKAIAEVRAAEREQCCKDVCWACGINQPAVVTGRGYKHEIDGEPYLCFAWKTRQRWAKEQAG